MIANSREYDEIAETIFRPIYKDIARMICERTGVREGRFLDVGCGGGHMGLAVLEEGSFQKGVLMDFSEEAVEIARSRAAEQLADGRIAVVCGDVHAIPFPDQYFDLVESRGSMYFWVDQERAFREIYRVMKPGAWACIGGGMGSRENRERAHRMMRERGMKRRDKMSVSLELTDPQYEELFHSMGVDYQIVRNEEEGHWLIFQRKV